MSKHLLASLAAVVAACAVAGGASADVPRTGDQRVGLILCALTGDCSDLTLAANDAFYVQHGFVAEPCADLRSPLRRFELAIDGVEQHGPIELRTTTDGLCDKLYVFNYRNGMTGTHSFTGCWYGVDGSLEVCGTRIVRFA